MHLPHHLGLQLLPFITPKNLSRRGASEVPITRTAQRIDVLTVEMRNSAIDNFAT